MFLHLVFLSKCDVAAGAFVKISHGVKGSGEMQTGVSSTKSKFERTSRRVCVCGQ